MTVITPSLPERAGMLLEACESVVAQTFQPAAHLIAVDYRRDGTGATINRLVRQSDTAWLSILADDDLYDPDHLESLWAERRDADIVLSWSRIEGREQTQYRGRFDPYGFVDRSDTGMRGCFMFRRSLYDQLGGWPTGRLEDWQFLVAAYRARARFVPVYRETWTYRLHAGSFSLTV